MDRLSLVKNHLVSGELFSQTEFLLDPSIPYSDFLSAVVFIRDVDDFHSDLVPRPEYYLPSFYFTIILLQRLLALDLTVPVHLHQKHSPLTKLAKSQNFLHFPYYFLKGGQV